MKKEIRPANLYDLDLIVELENKVFTKPWSKKIILENLKSKYSQDILYFDNKSKSLLAYLSFEDVLGDININKIACLESYRRKGLASDLIKYLLEYCDKTKANIILLEVSSNNEPAIKFYQRFGFENIYTRDNYYGQNDHALIMEKRL